MSFWRRLSQKMRSSSQGPEKLRIAQHVGIIMDGNGRWARRRGLPRLVGHRAGVQNLRRVLEACDHFGIKVLTIYAFSTENWGRPKEEVNGIMFLLEEMAPDVVGELDQRGVRIRHLGSRERISQRMERIIDDAIERTKSNDRFFLNIAFSYGGRAEILNAVRGILNDGLKPSDLTEDLFERYLYTAGLPPPDLIIRTGGEMRLSNFLIWQAAYAEYYSTPTYWPDFNKEELYKALLAYSQRERRFGLLREG
jgi:undecaprenyl diphosphate synthase